MEWIILVLVLAVVAWLMIIYNRLVALRQTCAQAWSDVDVQLKQRHDLIPNLVETVKGYASHEKETLERVIAARNAAASARTPEEAGRAEGQLAGMLRQVFALSEAYPELKANQNFLRLQAELSDIENKIAAARRFFNNAVAEFNSAIQQIPAVFFAASLGFTPRAFFELPEDQRAAVQSAPQVKF
ncbi:MAG: LemA family protein [Elioraea tepidiphila]